MPGGLFNWQHESAPVLVASAEHLIPYQRFVCSMKKRIMIYGGLLAALVGICLWWSAPRRQAEKRQADVIARLMASNPIAPEVLTNPAAKPLARPPGVSKADWQHLTLVRQMMLATNKRIEFHARVVEQGGTGVGGAVLELMLSRVDEEKVLTEFPNMKMGSEVVSEKIQLVSDAGGWFHLTGRRGTMVVVESLNPGPDYIWHQVGYPSFDYRGEKVLRDFENPTNGHVFRLWKKGERETLIPTTVGVNMNVLQEGQWVSNYFVSFLPPRVEWASFPEADLVIEGIRRPSGNEDRPFEFTFKLSVLNGGILLTGDAYPYAAPVTGYQSSWSFENKPAQNPPDFPWNKNFYFKLRGGKIYAGGRMDFCKNGAFGLSFNGHLNPDGSRSLEPDPDKLITDSEEIRRLNEATRVK